MTLQVSGDLSELEELREMRADVERRERAQAAVIESQAKRLEECEGLYREETLQRKKIFNAMEDMKVRHSRQGPMRQPARQLAACVPRACVPCIPHVRQGCFEKGYLMVGPVRVSCA